VTLDDATDTTVGMRTSTVLNHHTNNMIHTVALPTRGTGTAVVMPARDTHTTARPHRQSTHTDRALTKTPAFASYP
jgi:hypothetical protein